MNELPDCLFPSSNPEGIPDLDINMQADYMDFPMAWGSQSRAKSFVSRTIHFYVDDYRFNVLGNAVDYGHVFWKLWERPDIIWRSGAPSFIEINFSTSNPQPYAVALHQIYKKRHLARYWQSRGMRCFVDMNVAERHEDLNLLGVKKGWLAYATHYQKYYDLDLLMHQVELARAHAGRDDIRFAVFAHNKDVERFCQREGLIYCGEDWKARDESKRQKRIAASEKQIRIEPIQPKKISLEMWA